MNGVRRLVRGQLLVILIFIVFKISRPSLLKMDLSPFWEIVVWSFPNFCEALAGMFMLTAMALIFTRNKNYPPLSIYITSGIVAAIYVITQEMKLYNLGGDNVYDPYDVLFSVLGLIVSFLIILKLQPSAHSDRKS